MADHDQPLHVPIQDMPASYAIASRVGTAIWSYILWPIALLLSHTAILIFLLLNLLYRPLAFLLQPLVLLAKVILTCLLVPFRLLVKFETIYIYLGVAALVGLAFGLLHYHLSRWLGTSLGLAAVPEKSGRTAKQYREAKRRQKLRDSAPLMSAGGPTFRPTVSADAISPNGVPMSYVSLSEGSRGKARHGRGLLTQTIMEEVDSDY